MSGLPFWISKKLICISS
uniref:Uncharacterized protein n=1 Tax=Arundo donax TaxID=35708 RepID=A0A0A9CEE6_ARUDO